ncbi:hypothetical protein DYH55_08670 [Methylovirgula sp. 4M-Z18]|nr:hypothetical protein DYH55_08670 [Methylovirgula sp. 4M-Z18]
MGTGAGAGTAAAGGSAARASRRCFRPCNLARSELTSGLANSSLNPAICACVAPACGVPFSFVRSPRISACNCEMLSASLSTSGCSAAWSIERVAIVPRPSRSQLAAKMNPRPPSI